MRLRGPTSYVRMVLVEGRWVRFNFETKTLRVLSPEISAAMQCCAREFHRRFTIPPDLRFLQVRPIHHREFEGWLRNECIGLHRLVTSNPTAVSDKAGQ